MNVTKWIKDKLSRTRTWRRRQSRRRFEEQFAAELMVKPLENRYVLTMNELSIVLNGGMLTITDGIDHDANVSIQATVDGQYAITDLNHDQRVTLNGDTVPGSTAFVLASDVTAGIFVNAGEGDDAFTIDFTLGTFSDSITFNGGLQGQRGDNLTLLGGNMTFATVSHSLTDASSGTIDVTGNAQISYTGLEPILDNLNAANRVFTFNLNSELITLTDTAGPGLMRIDSDFGESVTFTNPTESL
jgi:hypothetical protein